MRTIVVGSGSVGTAVQAALSAVGHTVVSVGLTAGDFLVDITDIQGLRALFSRIGTFDAVACAAGDVRQGPFAETTDEQWAYSINNKGLGQINLVRAALPYIADGGSFTLISGVLTDTFINGGAIGTTVNYLVEGFVKGAAAEMPRGIRINCISPTVLRESTAYHAYFVGFTPVRAAEVGQAYLRAISNPLNGCILKLHKTNS